MSIQNLLKTSIQKPGIHLSLEVEALDTRAVPAVLNVADSLTEAAMPVGAIADAPMQAAPAQAAPAPVAAPMALTAPSPVTAPTPIVQPEVANAIRFPAADAVLAAGRPTAPATNAVPAQLATAAQTAQPTQGPNNANPIGAADNGSLTPQTLFAPVAQQPTQPITSTIPATMPTESSPLASLPQALNVPGAAASPFPADPFETRGSALATPLAEPMAEPLIGMQTRSAREREPAVSMGERMSNESLGASTVPENAVISSVARDTTAPSSGQSAIMPELVSDERHVWPLAPALAALYEVSYRSFRT